MTQPREHAVVIGGSLMGLLAARILTDHFAQVTLIERDRFAEAVASRPGLGQARHLHVLWSRGLEIAEQLFPGLEDELLAADVPEVRVPADMLWLTSAGWRRRFESTRLLTFSRDLLDWTVRARLAKIGNLRLLSGHEVTGLLADAGAVTESRCGSAGRPDRVSRSPRTWSSTPPGALEDPRLAGAARLPGRPADPDQPAAGICQPHLRHPRRVRPRLEGALPPGRPSAGHAHRRAVPSGGRTVDRQPLRCRRGLPAHRRRRLPGVRQEPAQPGALRGDPRRRAAHPIGSYRRTENLRRHYERMRAWPKRFLVSGTPCAPSTRSTARE